MSLINKLNGNASDLFEQQKRLGLAAKDEQPTNETAANTAAISPVAARATSSGNSVMADNFTKHESGQSKYVKVNLEAFGQENLMAQAQKQNTFALVTEAMALADPKDAQRPSQASAARYLHGLKSERMVSRKHREAGQEAGEQAARKVKEEREAMLKEHLAQKDLNGSQLTTEPGAGQAEQASQMEGAGKITQPVPDISASPKPTAEAPLPTPAPAAIASSADFSGTYGSSASTKAVSAQVSTFQGITV